MSSDSGSVTCFSGILRCLLCKGSGFPTHPSDDHHLFELSNVSEAKYRMHEANNTNMMKTKPLVLSSSSISYSSPGVVARLMGLESLPDPLIRNKSNTLGSYLRSRSVNSIDFLSQLEFKRQGGCSNNQQLHRRVRTSVSFHEDDYCNVVLRLDEVVDENDGFRDELNIKRRHKLDCDVEKIEKQKKRIGKMNERRVITRKEVPVKKVVDTVVNRSASVKPSLKDRGDAAKSHDACVKTSPGLKERRKSTKPVNCKESSLIGSHKSIKSKKIVTHKIQSGNNLQKIHPESTVRELENSSSLKRSSLCSNIAKSKSSSLNSQHSDNAEGRHFIEGKEAEKRKVVKNEEKCYYKRLVEVICNLTEESLDKDWKMMTMMHRDGVVLRFEDTEEICKQLEGEILEDMLTQFVVYEL